MRPPPLFDTKKAENTYYRRMSEDELVFFGTKVERRGSVNWWSERGFGTIRTGSGFLVQFNIRDCHYPMDPRKMCRMCAGVLDLEADIPPGTQVVFRLKYESCNQWDSRWKAKGVKATKGKLEIMVNCRHCGSQAGKNKRKDKDNKNKRKDNKLENNNKDKKGRKR